MKRLINVLLLCASLALVGCVVTGCGTTPAAKAAQAERVIITAVNDGMAEWRDYVNAGKATQKQIDEVRTAYDAYYAAQHVAKAILAKAILAETDPSVVVSQADIDSAKHDAISAEAALLALLNKYIL